MPPLDLGVVVLCGLEREAAILASPGWAAICGDAATLHARLAAVAGPTRLVLSWGLCGGLDPALKSGDLVVGAEVIVDDERFGTDATTAAALQRSLSEHGVSARLACLAAVGGPVVSASAKARLRAATGAAVVDMESGIAARFARERAAPFAVLRAVSDPAERNLPALVANAVDAQGRVDVRAIVRGLARSPLQLPGLVAAARDSRAAFASLKRAASGLKSGPGLG